MCGKSDCVFNTFLKFFIEVLKTAQNMSDLHVSCFQINRLSRHHSYYCVLALAVNNSLTK